MIAITFLQFVTAATGVAACVAIMRGLAGSRLTQLGNFYVDVTRACVRVFLPLALVVGGLLIWQGTPMTFEGAAKVIDAQANRLGEVRVLDGQLSRRRRGAEPGAVEGFGIAKCAGGDVGGQVVDRPLGAWRRRPTPFGFELVEKVGEGDGLRDGRVGQTRECGHAIDAIAHTWKEQVLT